MIPWKSHHIDLPPGNRESCPAGHFEKCFVKSEGAASGAHVPSIQAFWLLSLYKGERPEGPASRMLARTAKLESLPGSTGQDFFVLGQQQAQGCPG